MAESVPVMGVPVVAFSVIGSAVKLGGRGKVVVGTMPVLLGIR